MRRSQSPPTKTAPGRGRLETYKETGHDTGKASVQPTPEAIKQKQSEGGCGLPLKLIFDPSRYGHGYLLRGPSEAEVQTAILDTLAKLGVAAWPQDAGLKALRGKLMGLLMRYGMARQTAAGICATLFSDLPEGWPDVIGVHRGRFVAIEVKAPARFEPSSKTPGRMVKASTEGKPSERQIEFLRLLAKHGAFAGVAWSVRDALEIVGLLQEGVA